MKFLKIFIAFLLTIALLYIARTNSRGQSEFLSHQDNGYEFAYQSVPKGLENSISEIPVTVEGDFSAGQKVLFRRSTDGSKDIHDFNSYLSTEMELKDTIASEYFVEIQAKDRGGRFYYFFEVVDSSGVSLANMTGEENEPFLFKYIGYVSPVILISHIFFIFASVFCISMAATHAFPVAIGSSADLKTSAKFMLWAVIFCFVGGYPVGFAMNWYAFAGIWEGVPFGTDATDNKTQLLFVYIVFALLAMFGSLRGKPEKNLYSPKVTAWVAVISFFVMLSINLIPHSIQFTKELTYAVCYSYIGVLTLIYFISFFKKKPQSA